MVMRNPDESALLKKLEMRHDVDAERIKRLLTLPDLTKQENSPVKILFDRILNLPRFKDFDIVEFPRIVTVEENFDLLNTPKDHPSRGKTDTYYIDERHILRTQMTVMWSFYLKDKEVLKKLEREGEVMALSPGIVYRKDEIDLHHYPAFHQIDGLYLCEKAKKIITQKDLEEVQIDMAKSVLGDDIQYKFLVDTFPFTDPSVEMDILFNEKWLEVNGAGLVRQEVLRNFGIDPDRYNGWAFGFGDRLAMIKFGIPDIRILWSDDPRITSQFKDLQSVFKAVSKYPSIVRDISFIVDKGFVPNNYFELVRDIIGDMAEQVELIDTYENDEKLGAGKVSYAYRITYRSINKTLTNEEVNALHSELEIATTKNFGAKIR